MWYKLVPQLGATCSTLNTDTSSTYRIGDILKLDNQKKCLSQPIFLYLD